MINKANQDDLDHFVYYRLTEQIKNSPGNGHSPHINDALQGKYKLTYYGYTNGLIKVCIYSELELKEIAIYTFYDAEFYAWIREIKIDKLIK